MISLLKIHLKKNKRSKIWLLSSLKNLTQQRILRFSLIQQDSILTLESTAKKMKIGLLRQLSPQQLLSLNRKSAKWLIKCPELINFQTFRLLIIINQTKQRRICKDQIMPKQISYTHMLLSITTSSTSSSKVTWKTSHTLDIQVAWRPTSKPSTKRSAKIRVIQWKLMTC